MRKTVEAPDEDRAQRVGSASWYVIWFAIYATAFVFPASLVAINYPSVSYVIALLGLPLTYLPFVAFRNYLLRNNKSFGKWATDVLDRNQMTGVVVSGLCLVGWAGIWTLVAFSVRDSSLVLLLDAALVGVATLAFGGFAAYFTVPRVKHPQSPVPPPAVDVERAREELLKAWPKAEPETGDETTSDDEVRLRDDFVGWLASMKYYEAGEVMMALLSSKELAVAGAAHAQLDYIESSPVKKALFDAMQTYADGTLYGQQDPKVYKAWLKTMAEEAGITEEWHAWQTETRRMVDLKNVLDRIVSALLLVVFTLVFPVLPITAILLRIEPTDPKLPIVLKTTRVGRLGQPFDYFRFRARFKVGGDGKSVPGVISRILLLTSLDKAPALMNVVAGQMSLVGPDPLHWKHYQRVVRQGGRPELWLQRCRVKPGLIGPSQITAMWSRRNGYRCVDYLTRDAEYARSRSILGDGWLVTQQAGVFLLALLWRVPLSYREPGSMLRALRPVAPSPAKI